MILNGECGTFNPLLLECLKDIQGRLKEEMTTMSEERAETADSGSATSEFEGYEKTKEQGLKTILQAADYVKSGISVCIFPDYIE